MTANQMGQTAIHIASLWGHVDTIKALLRLGSDANIENTRGSMPLHFAAGAKENAKEACQALLDAGADPEVADMAGRKPFELAMDDEVRALLGGPDPKLFQYCAAGQHEALKELLISGKVPSVRVVDAEGRTPLNIAVHSLSIPTIQVSGIRLQLHLLHQRTHPVVACTHSVKGSTRAVQAGRQRPGC